MTGIWGACGNRLNVAASAATVKPIVPSTTLLSTVE